MGILPPPTVFWACPFHLLRLSSLIGPCRHSLSEGTQMLIPGREDETWKFPLGKCGWVRKTGHLLYIKFHCEAGFSNNEVLVIEIKTKWTFLGAFDKGKAHLFRVHFVWSCLWGAGVRERRWEKGQLKIPKQVQFSHWDYLFTHLLKSDGSHHCSCFAWFARTPPGHIKKIQKSGTLFFMLGFIKINYGENICNDILFLSHWDRNL